MPKHLTHNRLKFVLGAIILFLFITAGAGTYYLKFYKEDINKPLPMKVTVNADDKDLEGIAYRFWFSYMQQYKDSHVNSLEKLSDARFNKFQLLAGDENEFAVSVTFWVQLESKKWSTHRSWGQIRENGTIKDIQWIFRIKKTGKNKYTLKRIEDASHTIAGLTPLKDTYQKDAGIKIPDEINYYRIENEKLEVTYDKGNHWQGVPIDIEELFQGEYSGSMQNLIEGSYVIKPERTAFVIGNNSNLKILLSTNKGKSWEKVNVPSTIPGVRLRLLGFTSEQNGYLILTGERTMSSEVNTIFKTNDGGKSWTHAGSVEGTYRLVTSGCFIDENLGFMSFSSISVNDQPARPSLYRTTDGGKTWNEVDVPIPIEYKGIFTVAQTPTFDGSQGTLLVNQGPNGDYQGGKVLARFISVDKGTTWSFANLVDPAQVLNK